MDKLAKTVSSQGEGKVYEEIKNVMGVPEIILTGILGIRKISARSDNMNI